MQKIIDAREAIESFEEQLQEKHYEWQKEIEERRKKAMHNKVMNFAPMAPDAAKLRQL